MSTSRFSLSSRDIDNLPSEAGGDDEFNGKTISTFVRPDGTELGTQAHCNWLQAHAPGFRDLLNYLYKRYKLPILYVFFNFFESLRRF